jgi:signal transduction histidine kinase
MTSNDLWIELGLTIETAFKREAIPYWLQYPPKEFLESIAHELITPAISIRGFVQLLQLNPAVTSLPLANGDAMSVQQVLDLLLQYQATIADIAVLLSAYAKKADFTEPPTES